MTLDELRQAAIDYLGKAFNAAGTDPVSPSQVVQAAVSILLTPAPKATTKATTKKK